MSDRRNVCKWASGRYSMDICGEGSQCPALGQARLGFHVRGDSISANRLFDTLLSGNTNELVCVCVCVCVCACVIFCRWMRNFHRQVPNLPLNFLAKCLHSTSKQEPFQYLLRRISTVFTNPSLTGNNCHFLFQWETASMKSHSMKH